MSDSGSVSSLINITLDSEILAIEQVLKKLNESAWNPRDVDGFTREIIERFGLAGYNVAVTWNYTNFVSVYMPTITIVSRTEKNVFDHDKMSWEVQHNILGLETAGAVQPDGSVKSPIHQTAFTQKD